MLSGSEPDVMAGLQSILDRLAPGRFLSGCQEKFWQIDDWEASSLDVRLNVGIPRPLIAVEVANVNTTQLVGESCRLYYDVCPLKLLVLGDRTYHRMANTV